MIDNVEVKSEMDRQLQQIQTHGVTPLNGIFNKLIVENPHYVNFYLEVYMKGKQQDLTDIAPAMNSGGLIRSGHYY